MTTRESSKRHILLSSPLTISGKPEITIPIKVVRTVQGHLLWCSAKGTVPIKMSLLQNSTILAQGTEFAAAKVGKEGNVTCMAINKAASVSITFPVTVPGLPFLLCCLLFVFFFLW